MHLFEKQKAFNRKLMNLPLTLLVLLSDSQMDLISINYKKNGILLQE